MSSAQQKKIGITCPPALRLPHRNDAKIAKNLQLLDVLACNSADKASFQNREKGFFSQHPLDGKSAVTFQK